MNHPNAPEENVLAFRAPPHSSEAEQSLIGAVLLDNRAFDRVSWLAPNAFYEDRHRRVWSAIVRLIEAGREADVVTVSETLGDDLERAGGAAYLAALTQTTPTALNAHRYAEIVRDKRILRELAQRGTDIAEKALAASADPRELAQEAEASIMAVLDDRIVSGDVVHIGQAATEYVDWVDAHPNGIETGLKDFDALTGGLLPGNLLIIAGRTHMGKTSLALQFAEHICEKAPGVMFSLEATRREIAGRLVEWHKHRAGRDAAVDKVFRLNLFIDDSARISPAMMRARLRRAKRQHGLSLVVVDYLQLVAGKGDTREQEVAHISRELKAIGKEFEVPVIALAQLNRDVEKRADKKPYMSDLRESGAIEQDADIIALLYRPDYYDANFEGSMAEAEIHVPKNRNTGRTGLVKVMFSRDIGRFGDWVPERFRPGAAA